MLHKIKKLSELYCNVLQNQSIYFVWIWSVSEMFIWWFGPSDSALTPTHADKTLQNVLPTQGFIEQVFIEGAHTSDRMSLKLIINKEWYICSDLI